MDEIQLILTGDDAAEAADALEALVAEVAPEAQCTRGTTSRRLGDSGGIRAELGLQP